MLKAFSLPGFKTTDEESLSENESSDSEIDDDESIVENETVHQEFHNDLSSVTDHMPCFAHTLQLVIKDGFKQAGNITKVLCKVSTIVSFSKKSTLAAEVLEAEKRLKTANATRWNSQLQTIRSVLRIGLMHYYESDY